MIDYVVDYVDYLAAVLVICFAAAYIVRAIWDWRKMQKLRRGIMDLEMQGEQILKLIDSTKTTT